MSAIVWLVNAAYDYEGESTLGIFSSEELAREFIGAPREYGVGDDIYLRPVALDGGPILSPWSEEFESGGGVQFKKATGDDGDAVVYEEARS